MDLFLVFFVIMRSAAADCDSLDHFVVISITMRSVAVDGDAMDMFLVFLSLHVLLQQMW